MKYEYIIVGAGIAGITIAELLQRSGKKVLLIEKNRRVCSCATAEQHGWFHTGSLYASLPTNKYFKAMVSNLDNIRNFYSGFQNMNLDFKNTIKSNNKYGWFQQNHNYYLYASPLDKTIPLLVKLIWKLAIIRAKSRLAWFETLDFEKELQSQIVRNIFNFSLGNRKREAILKLDLHKFVKTSEVLRSQDRGMNSNIIISDLLNSFAFCGGDLLLENEVVKIKSGMVYTENKSYNSSQVIVTSGKNIEQLTNLKVRIVKSPMLVVKPAITNINFIIMHPKMNNTLNHIYHNTEFGDYSLFGNAIYYDSEKEIDSMRIKLEMVKKVNSIFSTSIDHSTSSLYWGYKTEVQRLGLIRNYQYNIHDLGDYIVALPGKMTLAFSLAVSLCKYLKVSPTKEIQLCNKYSYDNVFEATHFKKYLEL
ncbi:MAG: NAD(P)-binding protein [Bacteroidales bacterium]